MKSVYIENKVNDFIQPKGGIIPLHLFTRRVHGPGSEKLHMDACQNVWLLENSVRNLSRYLFTDDPYIGFQTSLSNVEYLYSSNKKDLRDYARLLLEQIFYLDKVSITSAISLTALADFDTRISNVSLISDYANSDLMIEDIKLLVRRTLAFYKLSDSKVSFAPSFCCSSSEPCVFGKSDFIGNNFLWDLAFRTTELDIKDTLCAVCHFCMAKDNQDSMRHYIKLDTVGIYNPILNTSYILPIERVDDKSVELIKEKVIGLRERKITLYQDGYSNSLFINGRINPAARAALNAGTYYG